MDAETGTGRVAEIGGAAGIPTREESRPRGSVCAQKASALMTSLPARVARDWMTPCGGST